MNHEDRVHIIAEAGTNHGGCLNTALNLARIGKDSGADSVKFQIIYPEGLYLPQLFNDGKYDKNEVFQMRQSMMMTDKEWGELSNFCQELQLPISASVFDVRGLMLLNSWDPPYFKIASCDLNYGELLREAADYGRKIILSTGMSTLPEIEEAVNILHKCGHKDLVIMHCVSAYPCSTEDMNLAFISDLAQFGFPLGLSDHTENSIAAVASLPLGVKYIEKHYTYDRSAQGFDHSYAMEPHMLKQYVDDIRKAEQALMPKVDKLTSVEQEISKRARRSLYAARDINPGTTLTREDILTVRPAGELEPNKIHSVIGQSTDQTIKKFQPIPSHLIG